MGQAAFVSGSSRGIGRAIDRALAAGSFKAAIGVHAPSVALGGRVSGVSKLRVRLADATGAGLTDSLAYVHGNRLAQRP